VLWCETAICEERTADGATVTRRAFGLGEQVNGQTRFFATDHLGSVREVTDGAGALLARYAFDPWGRRTVTAGTDVTSVGFTGHRTHAASGLALALYRGYDAGLGRWVSEDPIGFRGGSNFYRYVDNAPAEHLDLLGDQQCTPRKTCSVQVRCRSLGGLFAIGGWLAGAVHCYIVVKDSGGTTRTISGGQDQDGNLEVWNTQGQAKGNSDGDRVVYSRDPVSCDKVDCVVQHAKATTASRRRYGAFGGPNCNTWAQGAIAQCGVY
jgi:RHS repeat-associated protein